MILRRPLQTTILLTTGWLMVGCATAPQQPVAMVQGGDVEVHVHLSEVSPLRGKDEFHQAASALAARPLPGIDEPLLLRHAVIPMPPPQGTAVTLKFAVSAQGYVIHPQLKQLESQVGPPPPGSLGLAMLRVLTTWRFDPPRQEQQPVAFCCVTLVVD